MNALEKKLFINLLQLTKSHLLLLTSIKAIFKNLKVYFFLQYHF